MEARGNGPKYPYQYVRSSYLPTYCEWTAHYRVSPRGTNYVRGSLNWGPNHILNRAYKTYGWWTMRRGSYDEDFHTYSLEWDENFM
jgi:hypothetical protein